MYRRDLLKGAGAAIGGARVQGFDVRNTLAFDTVTAPNGQIPAQDMIQYIRTGTTPTDYTPHTLQVTAHQMVASQQVSIDANKTVTLSIPLLRMTSP